MVSDMRGDTVLRANRIQGYEVGRIADVRSVCINSMLG